MGADHEVRAKLKLDDEASDALHHLRHGFEEAEEGREHAQEGFDHFKEFLSFFAAELAPEAIHELVEFGESFVEAARESDALAQSLGGLIAVAQDIPWEEARAQGEELNEQLNDIGLDGMQAIGDVKAGFNSLLEKTGASAKGVEMARTQISLMTTVANVLGKSVNMIAGEFGLMQDGMLRTRGQMFQLLQQTGIFGKDTHKAAAYWATLTDDERMKRLNYALGEVSGKLKAATPTFNDLLTSIKNTWEVTKEKIGEPLLAAIGPELNKFTEYLDTNREEIEKLAHTLGHEVGDWVKAAAAKLKEGLEWLKEHEEEIGDAIKEGYEDAKAVVEWILAHKEELAIAFGAKTLAGSQLGGIVSNVAKAGAAEGAPLIGLKGGLLGATAALAAFSAAVYASGKAAEQAYKLEKETGKESTSHGLVGAALGGLPGFIFGEIHGAFAAEARKDAEAQLAYLDRMKQDPGFEEWSEAQSDHLVHVKIMLRSAAEEMGKTRAEVDQMVDDAVAAHQRNLEMVKGASDAAKAWYAAGGLGGAGVDVQQQNEQMAAISQGFKDAMAVHNQGAVVYIANLISKSKELQTAFLTSSNLTNEGFNSLAEVLEKAGGFDDLVKKLKEQASLLGGKSATPKAPQIHFNGGQTFKIQQDFKNDDPDRIAIVFQRDIARAAVSRLAANTSSPFGT